MQSIPQQFDDKIKRNNKYVGINSKVGRLKVSIYKSIVKIL